MTDLQTGTYVYLTPPNGSTPYYLSPGCSITETYVKGVQTAPSKTTGLNTIYIIPTDVSWTLRIDTQILNGKYVSNAQDGLTEFPNFDPSNFNLDLRNTDSGQLWTLKWGSMTRTGVPKSYTITQRSGEGSIMDLAITFEVAEEE